MFFTSVLSDMDCPRLCPDWTVRDCVLYWSVSVMWNFTIQNGRKFIVFLFEVKQELPIWCFIFSEFLPKVQTKRLQSHDFQLFLCLADHHWFGIE